MQEDKEIYIHFADVNAEVRYPFSALLRLMIERIVAFIPEGLPKAARIPYFNEVRAVSTMLARRIGGAVERVLDLLERTYHAGGKNTFSFQHENGFVEINIQEMCASLRTQLDQNLPTLRIKAQLSTSALSALIEEHRADLPLPSVVHLGQSMQAVLSSAATVPTAPAVVVPPENTPGAAEEKTYTVSF